jgi:hypothetical protein
MPIGPVLLACYVATSPTPTNSLAIQAMDAVREAPQTAAISDQREAPVLSDPELQKKYVWARLGIEGAIGATSTGGFMQWLQYPPEWTGKKGYAQRWASAYGETAVAESTKYAVSRLLHHDPSFTPCRCTGVGARLRYALVAPFTARQRDGTRVLSPAIFVGLLTGQVVSRTTWYPEGYGIGDGLETTATGLLTKMGISIWKEFRPRRRSLFNFNALKP